MEIPFPVSCPLALGSHHGQCHHQKGWSPLESFFSPTRCRIMAWASVGAICTGGEKGLLKTDGTHRVSILLPELFHLTSLYLWTIPRLFPGLISIAVGTESMPEHAGWVSWGHQG